MPDGGDVTNNYLKINGKITLFFDDHSDKDTETVRLAINAASERQAELEHEHGKKNVQRLRIALWRTPPKGIGSGRNYEIISPEI